MGAEEVLNYYYYYMQLETPMLLKHGNPERSLVENRELTNPQLSHGGAVRSPYRERPRRFRGDGDVESD